MKNPTVRDRILTLIASEPPFPTTGEDLARRVGASTATVFSSVRLLVATGKLRIIGKEGHGTIFQATAVKLATMEVR